MYEETKCSRLRLQLQRDLEACLQGQKKVRCQVLYQVLWGAVIGGFVGGTLGYMAGSKIGETVVKTMQKVRDKVCDAVGELWETGREFIGNAVETVRDKISEIGDFLFGWL